MHNISNITSERNKSASADKNLDLLLDYLIEEDIRKSVSQAKRDPIYRRLYRYASASAVLLLVLAAAIFMWRQSSNEKLFAEYYSEPISERTRSLDPSPPLVDDEVEIYQLAHEYVQQKENIKALEIFIALSDKEGHYKEASEWFAALMRVRLNDRDAAKRRLMRIVDDSEHLYLPEATELLATIR